MQCLSTRRPSISIAAAAGGAAWRKPWCDDSKSLLRNPPWPRRSMNARAGNLSRSLATHRGAWTDGKVLLCSGKIYFDLIKRREEGKNNNTAIIRIEQLYPLSDAILDTALDAYTDDTPVVWVQEEPENMAPGAICGAAWGANGGGHPFFRCVSSRLRQPRGRLRTGPQQELRVVFDSRVLPDWKREYSPRQCLSGWLTNGPKAFNP